MQLSKNFFLHEMLRSETAARMGRVIKPPQSVVENLIYLCKDVLQPVRDALSEHYGQDMPISVSSGYRPLWLNSMVGGSTKSDHIEGLAADIGCPYIRDYELAAFIAGIIQKLPIKDLGLEFGQWVHVAASPRYAVPKREIWTAKKVRGKTKYLSGLVA